MPRIKSATWFLFVFLMFYSSCARATDWLPPTAELKTIGGFSFVTQNGLVYDIPSPNASPDTLILNGAWRKQRTPMGHTLSLTRRAADVLGRDGPHHVGQCVEECGEADTALRGRVAETISVTVGRQKQTQEGAICPRNNRLRNHKRPNPIR